MRKLPKSATRKDVLYALQFGGERLLRTYVHDERPKGGAVFSLSKTGIRVDPNIATTLLADPHLTPIKDGLFPGHSSGEKQHDPQHRSRERLSTAPALCRSARKAVERHPATREGT